MGEAPQMPSRAEREARRALVVDALTDLATSDDPERAADEVLRALDGYLAAGEAPAAPWPAAAPDAADRREARSLTLVIVGAAALATA
ncbi:MAG: hypothetical protein AB1416_05900, partial [Actinomycetota bacterium]